MIHIRHKPSTNLRLGLIKCYPNNFYFLLVFLFILLLYYCNNFTNNYFLTDFYIIMPYSARKYISYTGVSQSISIKEKCPVSQSLNRQKSTYNIVFLPLQQRYDTEVKLNLVDDRYRINVDDFTRILCDLQMQSSKWINR